MVKLSFASQRDGDQKVEKKAIMVTLVTIIIIVRADIYGGLAV